jgi:quinol monooxygenase YgiN
MLLVTGSVTVRPEAFEEALRLAKEHVGRSRLEPGCISHEVTVSADDPNRLVFLERWADEAALKAHFAVPASGAFIRRLRDLAVGPTEMDVYVAGKAAL